MSAAPSLAFEAEQRRGVPRYSISTPLDVIALRSGIPDDFPGRCTDLSEAGVGAIVAGEFVAGQQVAVEFRLPNVREPVRARAQVCYQERLRCGFQFLALPEEQREQIRAWAELIAAPPPEVEKTPGEPTPVEVAPVVVASPDKERRKRKIRVRRQRFYVLLALTLTVAGVGAWQWQKAWNELDAQASNAVQSGSPLRVAADIVQQQIVFKVNPEYPEAARLAGLQGLVVLDVVIAADGTVKQAQAVAGPGLLARAAVDAVRSWRFEPYRAGGEAVEIETTLIVDFRLH